MPRPRMMPPRASSYGVAALAVLAATLVRLALAPAIGQRQPFFTYYVAVVVAAWLGGLGPSLLALGLGLISGTYFFTPPLTADTADWLAMASFLLVGGAIVAFGEGQRLARSGLEREVTDRRLAEEALRESEGRFQQLAATIGDVFWMSDPRRRRVLYVSPAYEAIWGRPREALHADCREWLAAIHPEDRPRVEAAFFGGVLLGTYDEQYRVVRPDGTIRWVRDRGYPVRDESGEVLRVAGIAEDITERRRDDERLVLLSRVLESMSEGVSVFDEDGTIFYTNPAEDRMFGCLPGELVGRNVTARGADRSEDSDCCIDRIVEGLEPGGAWSGECRNRRKDGTVFWTHARITVVEREGRRCWVRVQEDITERRRSEEVLRSSERRLQQLADTMPQIVWTAGPDGAVDYFNGRWYEYTGMTPEQALADDGWRSAIHPEDLHRFSATRAEAVGDDALLEAEVRVRRRDGAYRWHLVRSIPVMAETGRVAARYGTATDIDDRMAAENALRLSEERFRLAAEAVNGIIYDFQLGSDRVERTRGLFEVLGYRPEEVPPTGQWWWEQIHPEDRARLVEQEVSRTDAAGRFICEYRVRHRDGRYLHVEDRSVVLLRDGDGGLLRRVGCTQDISEIRRVEAALREADRRKDEFLATLAHELRNPLAPIRHAVALMRAQGPPDPELRWAGDVVDRQVQNMAHLLDDLLDVSRITRNRLRLRKCKVEVAAVVRAAVETSRPLIEAGGHELTVALPGEPVILDADPTRLAQVFSNLLNNAAKYSEECGRIALSVDRHDGQVSVTVRDEGIGIDAEHLARIFEMFSQVDPALERSQGGLGIGLALVRGLVDLHGGTVEARSGGPGAGSEFVVRLPVAADACAPDPEEPPARESGDRKPAARLRVLLVDDNVDSARTLGRLLRLAGHEIRLAHDGPAALAEAEACRPEVAVLDIGLPGLDGYEVARWIREQPWGSGVKLIALTGWGQESDRQRSQEAGFDHHLVKPVDPDLLLGLLRVEALPRAAATG